MLIATEHNDPHCHNPKFPFSQPILAIFRKVNQLCRLDFFVDYSYMGGGRLLFPICVFFKICFHMYQWTLVHGSHGFTSRFAPVALSSEGI